MLRSPSSLCLALAAGVLLAAGISGCGSSPTQVAPADQAKAAAAAALAASHAAKYQLESSNGAHKVDVTVAQTPSKLRIDVTSTNNGVQSTAVSIFNSSGVVSCVEKPGSPTSCVQTAGPGKQPPTAFDPGLQRIFRDTMTALANQTSDVHISATTSWTSPHGVTFPCYVIQVDANSTVSPGTVCVSDQGNVGRAVFSSGTLTWISDLPAPTAATFVPPAKVTAA
jgi:outer membrane lipoprotein-sorting protein